MMLKNQKYKEVMEIRVLRKYVRMFSKVLKSRIFYLNMENTDNESLY